MLPFRLLQSQALRSPKDCLARGFPASFTPTINTSHRTLMSESCLALSYDSCFLFFQSNRLHLLPLSTEPRFPTLFQTGIWISSLWRGRMQPHSIVHRVPFWIDGACLASRSHLNNAFLSPWLCSTSALNSDSSFVESQLLYFRIMCKWRLQPHCQQSQEARSRYRGRVASKSTRLLAVSYYDFDIYLFCFSPEYFSIDLVNASTIHEKTKKEVLSSFAQDITSPSQRRLVHL